MLNNILIIVSSIILSSTAHVLLKKGMMMPTPIYLTTGIMNNIWQTATNPWVAGGMFMHISALVVWLLALNRVDITFAYPFLALGYVLVSLMAWFWLGEQITVSKLWGMSVICVGILILSIGERTTV